MNGLKTFLLLVCLIGLVSARGLAVIPIVPVAPQFLPARLNAHSVTLKRGTVLVGKVDAAAADGGIHDGDTLRLVADGLVYRIRLFAVDAPEFKGHDNLGHKWPDQPYREEARDTLKSLVLGNTLRCTIVSRDRDRYVCTIQVGKKDVAEEMLRAGAALVDPRYGKSDALKAAQADAQANQRGQWGLKTTPIEPRLWRAGQTSLKRAA